MKKTTVVFLLEQAEADFAHSPVGVFAFFPHIPYNSFDDGLYMSYSTIGQHSACSIDYAKGCKFATEDQYQDLWDELEQIGYKNIRPSSTIPNTKHSY